MVCQTKKYFFAVFPGENDMTRFGQGLHMTHFATAV
jgi:hypothetical protein